MDRYFLVETEIAPRLLLKLAGRVSHVQSATTIADRHSVQQDILAKPDGNFRVERFHKAVAKRVSRDHVGMPRTEDQIPVGVDPGPVERHETALVPERIEIVGKPLVKVSSA